MPFLALILISLSWVHAEKNLDVAEIRKALGTLHSKQLNFPDLPSHHPDQPIVRALQALEAEAQGDDRRIIERLESLLLQTHFKGRIQQQGANKKFVVGSFDIWRDVIYLLLGRAYYHQQDYSRALHFYNGVSNHTRLSEIARLEKGWALLKTENWAEAEKNFALKASGQFADEWELQRSYLLMKKDTPQQAIAILNKPNWLKAKGWMQVTRWKILAQSHFTIYLAQGLSQPFPQKKRDLDRVIEFVEQVPLAERDSKFSFLAGEIYWNLASLLRIEDPVRLRNETMVALNKADQWLSPWYNKSLQQRLPLMSEEAFFFSAVVLWEQERHEQAIQRLLNLPQLFPQGEYREDAYQLIGDFYFEEKKNYQLAIRAYAELVKVGRPEKATYGLYKAAWAFYNINEVSKAIDHMRRLVNYHRQNKPKLSKSGEPVEAGQSLEVEAIRDLILFLAEKRNYSKALEELKSLNYTDVEWIEIKEKLSHAYNQIGRYGEAITGWRDLLSKEKTQAKMIWLVELAQSLLSLGERSKIAPAINEFLPALLTAKNIQSPEFKEFESKISNVILIVHREGRRTDDRSILEATDNLYDAYYNHLAPHTQGGAIWYHGAQRKEALKRPWDAIKWYKRDALNAKSESRMDSAHSVLRLLKNLLDEESLKSKPDPQLYARVRDEAHWYIQNFRAGKEGMIADLLYLEAANRSDKIYDGHKYFYSLVEKEGASDHVKTLFAHENARLYKTQSWTTLHDFTDGFVRRLPSSVRQSEFSSKLLLIQQEAAFQRAFELESQSKKDQKPGVEHRVWYKKAIDLKADQNVVLKSWHNMLVSYSLPTELKEFNKQVQTFLPFYETESKNANSDQELWENIWLKVAEAAKMEGLGLSRADALARAADHMSDANNQKAARFDALVLYGAYYNLPRFREELKKYGDVTQTDATRLTVARYWYWNREYDAAYDLLKPILKTKAENPAIWIMALDLAQAPEDRFKSIHELKEFLKKSYPQLHEQPVLIPVWATVFPIEKKWETLLADRKPAALAGDLKGRLDSVGQVLDRLNHERKVMKEYLQNPVVQLKVEAVCQFTSLTERAHRDLKDLTKSPLSVPQWPMFVERVKEKLSEFEQALVQEQKSCNESKNQTRYLASLNGNSPCPRNLCVERSVISRVRESAFKDPKPTLTFEMRLEKVLDLIQQRAFATAEYWAENADTTEERSLLLGMVRIANKDAWNGVALVENSPQSRRPAWLNSWLASQKGK